MKKFAFVAAVAALALSACMLAGCGADKAAYKQLDETLSAEHYAVGFKLGEDAVANQVTATLVQLDKDGVVKELCDKYADQGMSYENWCLDAENVPEVDAAAIPADYKLVVGFDAAYPPYGYIADDGSYTGFDLELAQAVCEANGWGFEATPIDWDSKDALIDSGQISCIWNGFTYEGREDAYAWSGCYMINAQVVVVKADSEINTLADLAGKNVQTQAGSAAYELLTGDMADLGGSFADLTTLPDYNNVFMNLDAGSCDAVACDLSVAAYYLAGGE